MKNKVTKEIICPCCNNIIIAERYKTSNNYYFKCKYCGAEDDIKEASFDKVSDKVKYQKAIRENVNYKSFDNPEQNRTII